MPFILLSVADSKKERGRETRLLWMAVFQAGELWFLTSVILPYCVAFFTKRVRSLTAGILPEGAGAWSRCAWVCQCPGSRVPPAFLPKLRSSSGTSNRRPFPKAAYEVWLTSLLIFCSRTGCAGWSCELGPFQAARAWWRLGIAASPRCSRSHSLLGEGHGDCWSLGQTSLPLCLESVLLHNLAQAPHWACLLLEVCWHYSASSQSL